MTTAGSAAPERGGAGVTLVHARDVDLPGIGTMALLTLDDGAGPGRPPTLRPESLASLRAAIARVDARARTGDVVAAALTGKAGHFAAGADLRSVRAIRTADQARAVAEVGHETFGALADLPVPTFAFIGGAALGGGLEAALACTYRTAADDAGPIGFPEVALGLVPGWGGCFALPRLVGPARALEVIVDDPLHHRLLRPSQAAALGMVDVVVPGADLVDASMTWASAVLRGDVVPPRSDPRDRDWAGAVDAARRRTAARLHGAAPAADVAIDLVAGAESASRAEAFAAEDDALVGLILSEEFRAGLYAWELTTHRAKHPTGAPPAEAAGQVRRVGVAGAGLMAGQLALLLARRLRVPVTMRDIDDERSSAGLAAVRAEIDRLAGAGRVGEAEAEALHGAIRATSDLADLGDVDLVVEAVVEDLDVKRRVFADLEAVVKPDTVLATNTSALSVTALAAALSRPERVVGMHFFNPVAQMRLVEVVRAERTGERALATAFDVVRACGKVAVLAADAPGFIVNRLLLRLLGEVLAALEEGAAVEVADRALWPMGLPMGPFQLLQLVGPAVAAHTLDELRAGLGHRYPHSPGLARMVREHRAFVVAEGHPTASSPVDPGIAACFGTRSRPGPAPSERALLRRVQDALADEARRMLNERVVGAPEDLDLAMILGAGWPAHLGGFTPYLDRVGASERVTGQRFHPPGVASLPAPQ